jgi:predicted Zn-dependent protease
MVACVVPVFVGCARPVGGHTPRLAAERQRAGAALARLTPALDGRAIRLTVTDSPTVAAYAWPDGRIVLTRALIRLLDDDELAAALAHEVGHLLADGHLRTAAALRGAPPHDAPGLDVESRADAAGCGLLTASGCAPGAMSRMLEKVAAAPGASKSARASLKSRIGRLKD